MVTVDIDGTLTRVHGWRVIAERFGRVEFYERTMARVRAHEAGEDETIAGLVSIAEGHTVPEVLAAVEATPRLSGIPEGVRRLHGGGMRVALLTHNPPYVTDWYRAFAGFDDAAGIRGSQATDPRIGPSAGIGADKPGGLAALVARSGIDPRFVVHVGDSGPDAAIFPLVGAGVALNARSPAVRAAADLAIDTTDFGEVVTALLCLPSRPER
ncbi:MAG: HAD hydrolase family protein [Thermoplasmata archaeon]|jgi:phosphoserine phosphatase|nr:HAD hydrolase family protein [Thermoplasmata archaeon]